MSYSERSRRETEPLPGVTRSKRARNQQGPDGFLDEPDFNSLTSTRMGGAHHEDSRTLAELADSVMAAASEEDSQAPEDSTRECELPGEAPPESADSPPDEPLDTSKTRSIGRWAAGGVVALLLFAVGALAFGTALDEGSSGPNAKAAGEGEAPARDAGEPPSGDEFPEAVVVDPPPSPVPTLAPATETVAADAGAITSPVPALTVISTVTAEPSPALTGAEAPTPTPSVAPISSGIHIGKLIQHVKELGKGAKVKVSVELNVHDSSHDLIAGASVSGLWSDTSGPIACTTGATGSCVFETGPLDVPGSVTFTVTGITYEGHDYEPAVNHDADGDSDGTSITVSF